MTGSLGQGLPYGVGMALAGKRLDRLPFRVWVLCGDSELAEGSVSEALEHAAFYESDKLTAIVDVNRLGQRGETMRGWDLGAYAARAFGCYALEVDGHDVAAIDRCYAEALELRGKPVVILARSRARVSWRSRTETASTVSRSRIRRTRSRSSAASAG